MTTRLASACLGFACIAAAQSRPAFEVASVKRSATQKGVDYRGRVLISPNRLTGNNVTLQHLIAVAYQTQQSQVTSPLKWLDSDEFDIDARADAPASELRAMLRSLLAERFHLVLRRETKDVQVQALVVDNSGPKFQSSKGPFHFHGDMHQFADLLALQATIPAPADANTPAIASSVPITVVDKTGLADTYEFYVDVKPELGTDKLTVWRRALKEQLGLRLESQKVKLEILRVTGADRNPASN